jgi:hypothetical protein
VRSLGPWRLILAVLVAAIAIVGALLLLRGEVMKSREASLRDLAEAAQGIRGDLGHAQRTLAEVRALEQGRRAAVGDGGREPAPAGGGHRRSSTRGAAGERARALALPAAADLLETNLPLGNRIVEYALRLPADATCRSTASGRRARARAARDASPASAAAWASRCPATCACASARSRATSIRAHIGLGLLAVPDALYGASPEAHGDGHPRGACWSCPTR